MLLIVVEKLLAVDDLPQLMLLLLLKLHVHVHSCVGAAAAAVAAGQRLPGDAILLWFIAPDSIVSLSLLKRELFVPLGRAVACTVSSYTYTHIHTYIMHPRR